MIEKTLEIIELEYRWMKRFARLLLLAAMALPLFQYGPLLWKDGSYAERWNVIVNWETVPIECRGSAYILQQCEVKFIDRNDGRTMMIEYLVFGSNWNGALPDLLRTSTGNYSSSIAVSGPGLLARASALLALFLTGLCIEKLALAAIWRVMLAKVPGVAPPPTRSDETVILSRDRRDHF